MSRNILVALAVTAWSTYAAAQSPVPPVDPLIGTWKQNVAQSTYSPREGRPPAGAYVDDQGLPSLRAISAANYDGREYPQHTVSTLATSLASHIGPRMDRTISYKRINAYTVQIVQKQGDEIVSKSTRTISPDGRTMTDRSDYTNAAGQRVTNVLVFDKQ